MFLKLKEMETNSDVYLNPDHIVRFAPNSTETGTLVYMSRDAGAISDESAPVIQVHELAEEIFRLITRHQNPSGGGATSKRGFL